MSRNSDGCGMPLQQHKQVPLLLRQTYQQLQDAVCEYCADRAIYMEKQRERQAHSSNAWFCNQDHVSLWLCMSTNVPTICEYMRSPTGIGLGHTIEIPQGGNLLVGVRCEASEADTGLICDVTIRLGNCAPLIYRCTTNVPLIFEYPVPMGFLRGHEHSISSTALPEDTAPVRLTLLYAHLPYVACRMLAVSDWIMSPGILVGDGLLRDVLEKTPPGIPCLPALYSPPEKPGPRWLLARELGQAAKRNG